MKLAPEARIYDHFWRQCILKSWSSSHISTQTSHFHNNEAKIKVKGILKIDFLLTMIIITLSYTDTTNTTTKPSQIYSLIRFRCKVINDDSFEIESSDLINRRNIYYWITHWFLFSITILFYKESPPPIEWDRLWT